MHVREHLKCGGDAKPVPLFYDCIEVESERLGWHWVLGSCVACGFIINVVTLSAQAFPFQCDLEF